MTTRDYRIYKVDEAGRLLGAPTIYAAESDQAALSFAMQLRADDAGVSVWQAGRLVLELGPDQQEEVRGDTFPGPS